MKTEYRLHSSRNVTSDGLKHLRLRMILSEGISISFTCSRTVPRPKSPPWLLDTTSQRTPDMVLGLYSSLTNAHCDPETLTQHRMLLSFQCLMDRSKRTVCTQQSDEETSHRLLRSSVGLHFGVMHGATFGCSHIGVPQNLNTPVHILCYEWRTRETRFPFKHLKGT